MKLLREIEAAGAPSDYLFARIRYRRSTLDSSGQGSWAGPGDPHQALRAEYAWVYAQLNRPLRSRLLPYFEYIELRTLVIALRHLAADDQAAISSQLQFSLLHQQLRKILLGSERASSVIGLLERLLVDTYPFVSGLTEHYLRQGPGALEQTLLGGYLQQAARRSRCRPLRELLSYLLDMRNLLALYKHLHWQVPSPPPLLAGGELALAGCEKIWTARDLPGLFTLMRKRTGLQGNPEESGVEDFMFQGLTAILRHAGRDPLQPRLILDYLWRCQLAARNRGLRLSNGSPQPETALREVTA